MKLEAVCLVIILILSIPILTCNNRESYSWYPYYSDYFSGDATDCDNGCCDPVICSLKGKCVWNSLGRNRISYSGYPEQCQDFKHCISLEDEGTCVKKIFNLS